jgi:hypothetical protein
MESYANYMVLGSSFRRRPTGALRRHLKPNVVKKKFLFSFHCTTWLPLEDEEEILHLNA